MPDCTVIGNFFARACGGLLPAEYWYVLGVLALVAALAMHLKRGRGTAVLTTMLALAGAGMLIVPFVTVIHTEAIENGASGLLTAERVQQTCEEFEKRIRRDGCDAVQDNLSVYVDGDLHNCVEEGYVDPGICNVTQK